MFVRILLVLLIVVPAGMLVHAQEKDKKEPLDERSAKAVASVEKKLEDMKGVGAKVEAIDEKYVREVFPNHVFVAVRFPLWPVARVPAEPLKSQNLFAVSKDGAVTHLPDSKKLEEFFKSTLKTQLHQDKTTRTWLRLRMEYLQDGFYKFKYPQKAEVTGPGSSLTLVTGTVEVTPEGGNSGSFKATVRFGRADDFTGVTVEENKIKQGMRPRVLGD